MGKSKELISFFEDMLSRQEYLIPLVAASFQYPIHYYGMTSAALLEDLFVDAAINFRNSYRREVTISRPERETEGEEASSKGVKGWDYQFQGEHFSHKVGKGINAVALLWDATVKLPEDKKWNYESTMVYVLSSYRKTTVSLNVNGESLANIAPAVNFRNKAIKEGQMALVAERISPNEWRILETVLLPEAPDIQKALPLDQTWEKMIAFWSKEQANRFDLFVSTKPYVGDSKTLRDSKADIGFEAHPGVYIFQREQLQGIEVTQNNRAVLLPATTVGRLAKEASENGMFVFMPSWYMAYAENRPADLYLAQKQEFEFLNSASRRRN